MGQPVTMPRLGIIVGMTSEARLLSGKGCAVAVGGGTPLGARRMAERLLADGATALISFGLAGGLDPVLTAGILCVPRAVLSNGQRYFCDETLCQALLGDSIPCLLAGEAAVETAADKLRLDRRQGRARSIWRAEPWLRVSGRPPAFPSR